MVSSVPLILDTLQPVLAGTAFDDPQPSGRDLSASIVWCAGAAEFQRRHPSVGVHDDPRGCVDLWVVVDEGGRLERAELEVIGLADRFRGQPIEEALPAIAGRLAELLHADDPD